MHYSPTVSRLARTWRRSAGLLALAVLVSALPAAAELEDDLFEIFAGQGQLFIDWTDLYANDLPDTGGAPITYSPPSFGDLQELADGFLYTPRKELWGAGADSFTYTRAGGGAEPETATVVIAVRQANALEDGYPSPFGDEPPLEGTYQTVPGGVVFGADGTTGSIAVTGLSRGGNTSTRTEGSLTLPPTNGGGGIVIGPRRRILSASLDLGGVPVEELGLSVEPVPPIGDDKVESWRFSVDLDGGGNTGDFQRTVVLPRGEHRIRLEQYSEDGGGSWIYLEVDGIVLAEFHGVPGDLDEVSLGALEAGMAAPILVHTVRVYRNFDGSSAGGWSADDFETVGGPFFGTPGLSTIDPIDGAVSYRAAFPDASCCDLLATDLAAAEDVTLRIAVDGTDLAPIGTDPARVTMAKASGATAMDLVVFYRWNTTVGDFVQVSGKRADGTWAPIWLQAPPAPFDLTVRWHAAMNGVGAGVLAFWIDGTFVGQRIVEGAAPLGLLEYGLEGATQFQGEIAIDDVVAVTRHD